MAAPRAGMAALVAAVAAAVMCGVIMPVPGAYAQTVVARWIADPWGDCSRPCGGGTQNRSIYCTTAGSGGGLAPTHLCPARQPLPVRYCNDFACPVRKVTRFSCNPDGQNCPEEQKQGGHLTMTVLRAQNLADKDGWGIAGGESDPYVEIKVYHIYQEDPDNPKLTYRRTKEVRNSNNPVWPDGGEALDFGTQESASRVEFTVWDSDTGFEGTGEVLGSGKANVIGCSKFMFTTCTESSWITLDPARPCYDSFGNFSSTAPCLQVQMDVQPLDVTVLDMYNDNVDAAPTTIARTFSYTNDVWGSPYEDQTEPIHGAYDKFEEAAGGTILRTNSALNTGLKNIPASKPPATRPYYARVSINLRSLVFVFRNQKTFDDNRPLWLRSTAAGGQGYAPSRVELRIWTDQGDIQQDVYQADVKEFQPGEIIFGDPLEGLAADGAAATDDMYIVVIRPVWDYDVPPPEYNTAFDRSLFIVQCWQFLLPGALLLWTLTSFMIKIRFRLDLIGTYLVSLQLPPMRSPVFAKMDEKMGIHRPPKEFTSQLASLWVCHLDEDFSTGEAFDHNREFRRNLWFATKAVQAVALSPLVVFFAWGFTAALTVNPPSVGFGILFVGSAGVLGLAAVHLWHLEGWRMMPFTFRSFAVAFVFVFCFLLAGVFSDPEPLSLFNCTAVALALNMVPMCVIVFTNDVKIRRAMARLSSKTQELSFLLKDGHVKSFNGLVGSQVYTINPRMAGDKFTYTGSVMRLFTKAPEKLARDSRMWYALAWGILLALAITVWTGVAENSNQGLATLVSVSVLDSIIYLLHRGTITLSPGFLCLMMGLGRAFITAFTGRFWLAGHGFAFFVFGLALGGEIVSRRLPIMTNSNAGAVAYFGWEEGDEGPTDVAGSPEFSLGYVSFVFLLVVVGSIFAFDDQIPRIDVGGTLVPVWVFAVAAFLLVLVVCCLNATLRAFHLEKRGILKTRAYLLFSFFTLPLMLAAVTEILLICSGLLMFAITGNSLILELVVFLPFIVVFFVRVSSQWVKNDYQLLQPPRFRMTDKDRMLAELAGDGDGDSDEDEDDEERDPDALAALEELRAGHVGAGGGMAGEGAGLSMGSKTAIALPPLQRTSETDADAAAALAAMPANPILPMTAPSAGGAGKAGAAAAAAEGGIPDDVSDVDSEGNPKPPRLADGKVAPEGKGADGGDAKGKAKAKGKGKRKGKGGPSWWARQRAAYIAWRDRESDPTKMSALAAFVRCKLTRTDYVTLASFVLLFTVVFIMGNVISAVEKPSWLGQALWLSLFSLTLTLAPIVKYFQVYTWTADMLVAFLVGMTLFVGGVLGLWVDVMDADINSDLTLYLFTLMIMYPALLMLGAAAYKWRDEGWKATMYVRFSMPVAGFLFFLWVVSMYVFASPYVGFGLTMLFFMFVGIVIIIRLWAAEDYYLKPLYRKVLDWVFSILSSLAVIVGLLADVDLFYCFSVAFILVGIRFSGRAIAKAIARPAGTPVFYSEFIFPIYSYDPDTHDVVSENHWGHDIAVGMSAFFMWGVFGIMFVRPLGFGTSITCVILVVFLVLAGYAATNALYRLGNATRFMDEAMVRHAAEQAQETFDNRRVPFKIECEEFVARDKREEELEAQLARYSSGRAVHKTGKQVRPRNTASEMAELIHDIHFHLHYRERTAREMRVAREKAEAAAAKARGEAPPAMTKGASSNKVAPSGGDDADAKMVAFAGLDGAGDGSGGDLDLSDPAAAAAAASALHASGSFKAPPPNKVVKRGNSKRGRRRSVAERYQVWKADGKVKASDNPYVRRADALYTWREVIKEVWFKGTGPLGFMACGAAPYKLYRAYFGGKKRKRKAAGKAGDAYGAPGGAGGEEEVDDEPPAQDSAAMLRGLWVQEARIAIEYYEEARAAAQFQMLLLVASEAKIATEAVLFQKFLREYRFKLMANGVHPPEDIFRTQSYATVDVHLVATWMQGLTPEQRERFRQLKERFTMEVNEQYRQRLIHDMEEEEAAKALLDERRAREHQMYQKRFMEFQQRRINRRKEAREVHNKPEAEVNEQEFLGEVEKTHYYCQPGMYGREHQFHDPEFPATMESVGAVQRADMVKGWRVASGININAGLFRDGTDPDDVYQGQLADGWLLSAISIVAASGGVGDDAVDPLVQHLFVSQDTTSTGVYGVRLYKNAQWETVWVDDFFPVLDNKFKTTRCAGAAFAYSTDFEELWVPLIEKAFAKYYGSYAMLERGYVHQALTDLTGGSSEEIFLAEASRGASKIRLWNRLLKYQKNGFLLGAGTVLPASSDRELMDSGLVFGAAYVIYDVRSIDGHKLLKLRNPPGDHGEWQGDWGDDSPLWTRRLKAKTDFVADGDDGTFWMSFDDFCLAFRSLYVCKYYDEKLWHRYRRAGWWKGITAAGLPCKHNPDCKVWNNPQFSLRVDRPTDVNVTLTQSYPDVVIHNPPHPVAAYFVRQGDGTQGAWAHRSLGDPAQDSGANVMDPLDDALGRGREVGEGVGADALYAERVRRLTNTNVAAASGQPVREREITFSVPALQPGTYTVLVAAYQAKMEGPFTLELHSNYEVKFKQIWPPVDDTEDAKMSKLEIAQEKAHRAKVQARAKVEAKLKKTASAKDMDAEEDAEREEALASVEEAERFMADAVKEAELKQHSAWIEQHDPTTSKTYFYNMETGESTWEVPEELKTSGLGEGLDEGKMTFVDGKGTAAEGKKKKKKKEYSGPKCSICQHHKPKGMKEDTHRLWCQDGHAVTDVLQCGGGCGAVVHPLCAGYTDDRPPPDSWICPLCADDDDDDY